MNARLLVLVVEPGVEIVVVLLRLQLDRLGSGGVAVPVAVLVGSALVRGDQLGEHAGERVDLVAA